MSFAKTVLNRVFLSFMKLLSSSFSIKSGFKISFTEDFKTEKSPSKPKSIPPQPENRESIFKVDLAFSSSFCNSVFTLNFTANCGSSTTLVFSISVVNVRIVNFLQDEILNILFFFLPLLKLCLHNLHLQFHKQFCHL